MSDQPNLPDENSPQQAIPITFARVLEILERGVFEEIAGLVRWSSNYTFLTSVTLENIQLPVIYKPQKGERPLWDFPDGTLCYRERAAFLVAEALEWQIVPPTVLRAGPRGLGSVQFFIDHNPEYHYFEFDETLLPQLARLALFDVIVNNADRKAGHCLVDSQGHLWGIDHGICFHATPKLRTVIWDFAGQPAPSSLLEALPPLASQLQQPENSLRRELDSLLSPREIDALLLRINRIVTDKHYPLPGLGPNQPWPPI